MVWACLTFGLRSFHAGANTSEGGLVTHMLLEERFLRETYPEYGEYSRRAKRVIPFVV